MADGELEFDLTVDEQALDRIEDRNLDIAGGDGSEARELDEERNERLQVLTRGLGRISSKLGQLALIAAALAGLSKLLGEVFDIGFEDVRDALVDVVDSITDPIENALGLGGKSFTEQTPQQQAMTPGPLGFASFFPEFFGLESGGSNGSPDVSDNKITASLFTSRDSLTGDSTQQEMEVQNFDYFTIEGGS